MGPHSNASQPHVQHPPSQGVACGGRRAGDKPHNKPHMTAAFGGVMWGRCPIPRTGAERARVFLRTFLRAGQPDSVSGAVMLRLVVDRTSNLVLVWFQGWRVLSFCAVVERKGGLRGYQRAAFWQWRPASWPVLAGSGTSPWWCVCVVGLRYGKHISSGKGGCSSKSLPGVSLDPVSRMVLFCRLWLW